MPARRLLGRVAIHRFHVTNTGEGEDLIRLKATTADGWTTTLDANVLDVPAGSTVTVPVYVTVPGRQARLPLDDADVHGVVGDRPQRVGLQNGDGPLRAPASFGTTRRWRGMSRFALALVCRCRPFRSSRRGRCRRGRLP